ncbi:hypothetical protein JNUCC1_01574 [Lentibacillus sp. JNUCC-1]|uniref:NAD(P)-dependent oxidoreductase n=1 Tax=Lentibacillus sp. JNUCC-1 TaxID=2654513 RepID=UPI0012E7EEAF|nr:NAD(P)-binding oxidoreductase [Lentibacillus sp. JNUCC-1]MUV37768.1 hypothetical protein [Lentibacillus sp. JNUCC-1]
MNILLLGATGRVGGSVLDKMLQDGHHVVAVVRSPEKLSTQHANLQVIEGDVLDMATLEQAMSVCPIEVVFCALNTDKNNTLSRYTPNMIRLMNAHHIHRYRTNERESPFLQVWDESEYIKT